MNEKSPVDIDTAAVRLSEELGMLVDRLRAEFPAIDEVWLIGDRVNDRDKRDAKWELLIFADAPVLKALRADAQWQRGDTRMLIAVDGDRFEPVAGEPDTAGRLGTLDWRRHSPETASYLSRRKEGVRHAAVRVR